MDERKERILHGFIHDYMIRHNYLEAAKVFSSEAGATSRPVKAGDRSEGVLAEVWSLFSDVYRSPLKKQNSPDSKGNPEPNNTGNAPQNDHVNAGFPRNAPMMDPLSNTSYNPSNANNDGPYSSATDANVGFSMMAPLAAALPPLPPRPLPNNMGSEVTNVAKLTASSSRSSPPDSKSD